MKKKLLLAILLSGCMAYSQTDGLNLSRIPLKSFTVTKVNKTDKDGNSIVNDKGVTEQEESLITVESLELKFLKKDIEKKKAKIDSLRNVVEAAPSLDDATKKNLKTIEEVTIEVENAEKKEVALIYEITKDNLLYKTGNYFMNATESKAFFNLVYENNGKRFKPLGNSGVNFGDNTASAFTELVAGQLSVFRVSLGTMVTSSNSEDDEEASEDEAYQRLVTYGGNTVLTFEYPILYAHSKKHDFNLISRFLAKGTADLPAFGTMTENWAGSGSLGLNFYGDMAIDSNDLRFFFNMNSSMIFGTDEFRDNLKTEENNFTFGQLTLGFVFLENFKISFIVATLSSEDTLQNRNIIAGGQVLR